MTTTARPSGADLIRLRHPEWARHERRWRFYADSYEGGDAYRFADYSISHLEGRQTYGFVPWDRLGVAEGRCLFARFADRNLVPRPSELDPRSWDEYLLRQVLTPVPEFYGRAIRRTVSRVYAQEVRRDAPGFPELAEWWADVDGLGTPIDKWMRQVVAPMLLAYGQLDLYFGRPSVVSIPGEADTRADVEAMGLDRCVAGYILPENMVWWRLDDRGRYLECLVAEWDDAGTLRYRHWDAAGWTLYDTDGDAEEVDKHPYGRVPIVRVFDERKARCRNVGHPRFGSVADKQKSYYNGDSELVQQDMFQSGATLMMPEEFLTGEGEVKVGSQAVLPIKTTPDGKPIEPKYLARPTGTAADIQKHMSDWADQIGQDSFLAKPAGATTSGTVAQSGISKAFDSQEGNAILGEASEALSDTEKSAASMVILIRRGEDADPADLGSIRIVYPKEFDLDSAQDTATNMANVHSIMQDAGQLPEFEKDQIARIQRKSSAGVADDRLEIYAREASDAIDAKVERRKQAAESTIQPPDPSSSPDDDAGDAAALIAAADADQFDPTP